MKSIKTWYWIITILFAVFMAFTAIPDVLKSPDAMVFIQNLGYPAYFIPFIGVAKLLGSVAILVPGFPRIKEWAYAGLFYDLIAAFYSVVAVDGFQVGHSFLVLIIVVGAISYFLNHKVYPSKLVSI